MSRDHAKKHHHKGDAPTRKHHHHDDDKGKLSASLNNRDGDDETTPGFQGVGPDAKKDIECDVVAVLPLKTQFDDTPMTKIIVNVGADDGVTDSMDAYLLANDGTRIALGIMDVLAGATHLTHDGSLTEHFIQYDSTLHVVINPSKK